jgi:ABC-type glycerol-3-phosphate transport system permease component
LKAGQKNLLIKATYMKQEETFFTDIKTKVEEYVRDRIQLFKLQLLEKVSKIVAGMFSVLLTAFIIFFILLFLSMMAGYAFAHLTHSLFYGFGIVALIYIILFFIILKIKNKVIDVYITNAVIDIFFDKNATEEDEDNDDK